MFQENFIINFSIYEKKIQKIFFFFFSGCSGLIERRLRRWSWARNPSSRAAKPSLSTRFSDRMGIVLWWKHRPKAVCWSFFSEEFSRQTGRDHPKMTSDIESLNPYPLADVILGWPLMDLREIMRGFGIFRNSSLERELFACKNCQWRVEDILWTSKIIACSKIRKFRSGTILKIKKKWKMKFSVENLLQNFVFCSILQ